MCLSPIRADGYVVFGDRVLPESAYADQTDVMLTQQLEPLRPSVERSSPYSIQHWP